MQFWHLRLTTANNCLPKIIFFFNLVANSNSVECLMPPGGSSQLAIQKIKSVIRDDPWMNGHMEPASIGKVLAAVDELQTGCCINIVLH